MTEKGSDELLRKVTDPDRVMQGVEDEEDWLADEEDIVSQTSPASDEPGETHPDPDETPDGQPPEFDPLPEGDDAA
jgi:hypothetical protein